ncbi:U3 snoRNP protein [Coemansia javaensis]|uniref:U3 snoRNP protein n=1 Tax=Coemansia javaensis TaxID=2761396 RepID=A0A9W8HC13_9FUNG|nr:U3 snoRNP protein [Coemansia javaensis]
MAAAAAKRRAGDGVVAVKGKKEQQQQQQQQKKKKEEAEASDAEMDMDMDEDEDDEMKTDSAEAPAHGGEPKKTGSKQQVGNAEIMALNEASMLFKSNLFRLQIDELLGETAVAAGSRATRGLDAALKQIRDVLVGLEGTGELTVEAAGALVRRLGREAGAEVAIPFPDPDPGAAGAAGLRLAFAAPDAVHVVGSYALGTAVRTRGGFNVDVVAQMPGRLLQERDHLNYRYFYKRAFYVAMVRVGLQRSAVGEAFDVGFELLRGDTRLPAVVLRPRAAGARRLAGLGRGCAVRIVAGIAGDALPLHRLAPARNQVRPAFLLERNSVAVDDDSGSAPPPTPQYSAALLGDALLLTHMAYLFETARTCPEFPRAAALLRIWRAQRSTAGRSVGARALRGAPRLGGFVLTMVLAWLVRSPRSAGSGSGARLAASMNAHQLFKGAIEFLAAHRFEACPVQFGPGAEPAAAFASAGGADAAVFVDPSGTTNLLAGVQPWELAELRMEARQTALDLSHHSDHRFDRVFLSAALTDVAAKYDHVFRLEIDLAQLLPPRHGPALSVARRLAELEAGHPVAAAQARIARLLGSALAAQARLVAVHPCADAAFEDRARAARRHVFYIGVVADPDEARRLVALGPSPDAQPDAAARFRALWGAKAELRRFRDGAIRLAAVWGAAAMPSEARAMILPRMVAFLLRRHFAADVPPGLLLPDDQAAADSARPAPAATAQPTDGSPPPPPPRLFALSEPIARFAATRDLAESDADQITFEAALAALDQLERDLRALEDQLPLRVLAVHPVAPALRYAALAPPKPLAPARDDAFIEPLHVLLEFAGSTKWPGDIAALHKVKAAFLLRLAECYAAAHPAARVAVASRLYGYGAADGLLTGASVPTLAAHADDFDYERDAFVDIRHAESGYAFRLSILCDHEGALLAEKAQDLRRAALPAHADAADAAHRRWLRSNKWRPRHHHRIHDLCQRHHPAASMTIRLLKRWLSRHMVLGQPVGVPEELAELLVARVFADAWNGLAAPASAYAGFVRCLQLLAEWRWKDDLCAVDFAAISGSDDTTDQQQKQQQHEMWLPTGMGPDACAALQKAFDDAKERNKIKLELRIATEDDPAAQWWGSVPVVLTRRLRSMAAASLHEIARCLDAGSDAHLPQVFTAPLADYDFVIRLNRDAVCRRYEQPPPAAFGDHPERAKDGDGAPGGDGKEVFKNLLLSAQQQQQEQEGAGARLPRVKQHANPFGQPGMIGFDPVALFVRDLVNVYRDSLLVFNDVHGGDCIAGLWNPAVVGRPVPFVAAMPANMQPVASTTTTASAESGSRPMAQVNTAAILEEIARIGEGLVESIAVNNTK